MNTSSTERNERFILDEYRANGLQPVLMDDGRPVSLTIARQNGAKLEPLSTRTLEAAE